MTDQELERVAEQAITKFQIKTGVTFIALDRDCLKSVFLSALRQVNKPQDLGEHLADIEAQRLEQHYERMHKRDGALPWVVSDIFDDGKSWCVVNNHNELIFALGWHLSYRHCVEIVERHKSGEPTLQSSKSTRPRQGVPPKSQSVEQVNKEEEKVDDNELRQWASRHDLQGSLTDLRCILEDARTLSATPQNALPTNETREDSGVGLSQEYLRLEDAKANKSLWASWVGRKVFIWSQEHGAWWRAAGNGYTIDSRQAGVYDFEDAWARTKHAGPEKQIVFKTPNRVPSPASTDSTSTSEGVNNDNRILRSTQVARNSQRG